MADVTRVIVTFTPNGIEDIEFTTLKYVDYVKLFDVYNNMVKGFQIALERENRKTLLARKEKERALIEMSDEEKRNLARDKFLKNVTEIVNG